MFVALPIALAIAGRETFTIVATSLSCLFVAPVLLIALIWVANSIRRTDAEARIREAEAEIRECDAQFAKLRVRVAEQLLHAMERSPQAVSEALTQELLRQQSPAISDLAGK